MKTIETGQSYKIKYVKIYVDGNSKIVENRSKAVLF